MNYGAAATIKKRNEPNARFWAAAGRVDDPRARLLSVRFARKRKSQAPGGYFPFAFMHLMALHESVRRLLSYSGHGEMNELWSARYYKKRKRTQHALLGGGAAALRLPAHVCSLRASPGMEVTSMRRLFSIRFHESDGASRKRPSSPVLFWTWTDE